MGGPDGLLVDFRRITLCSCLARRSGVLLVFDNMSSNGFFEALTKAKSPEEASLAIEQFEFMNGPRSEPPIPMFTTSVIALPV